MNGGGSSSEITGQRKSLGQGAGEKAALIGKENFEGRPHPIEGRFTVALSELVGMCAEAGMGVSDMAPILEKEAAWCRRPYQNPEDNEHGGESENR